MKDIKNIFIVFVLLAAGVVVYFNLCSVSGIYQKSEPLMDTYCTIQAEGRKNKVFPAIEKAFKRMKEIDQKFSAHNPISPVTLFNITDTVIKDREIINLFKVSYDISQETNGAFDCTVYPLVMLWREKGKLKKIPSDKEIKEHMQRTGYRHFMMGKNALEKNLPETGIDFGGIAKGYALQEAARVLQECGIRSALIDTGGDIYALGVKKKQEPWKVGVRNPRGEGTIGILHVSNTSVVTSGDYERFVEINGKKYHHIIDPRTGFPAEQKAVSVTVMCPDPVRADAWATALFVLGIADGLELVEKDANLEALFIQEDGSMIRSSGMYSILTLP